jgi:hypothetical protein
MALQQFDTGSRTMRLTFKQDVGRVPPFLSHIGYPFASCSACSLGRHVGRIFIAPVNKLNRMGYWGSCVLAGGSEPLFAAVVHLERPA